MCKLDTNGTCTCKPEGGCDRQAIVDSQPCSD